MQNKDLLAELAEKMPSFSKGQKRIAKYLLAHYDKSADVTAAELSQTTQVSESTVVRFANAMGFAGYPEFQQALKSLNKTKLTANQRVEAAAEQFNKETKHILHSVLKSDAMRILHSLNTLDVATFDRVVEELVASKRIFIIGARSSASLASFFGFYLSLMLDNVVNINTTVSSEIFEQILHVGKGDLCIGISFPRYSQRTLKALEYAANQSATVVAITDASSSPIADFAHCCLICRSDMLSVVDSLVAPLSLINALLVAVSMKKKTEIEHNLEKLETLWREYQIYLQQEEANR